MEGNYEYRVLHDSAGSRARAPAYSASEIGVAADVAHVTATPSRQRIGLRAARISTIGCFSVDPQDPQIRVKMLGMDPDTGMVRHVLHCNFVVLRHGLAPKLTKAFPISIAGRVSKLSETSRASIYDGGSAAEADHTERQGARDPERKGLQGKGASLAISLSTHFHSRAITLTCAVKVLDILT